MECKTIFNSMPAFWAMMVVALLALFWALASGVQLGFWIMAFVVTAHMGRLVASLLGSVGVLLYSALIVVALLSFILS